MVPQISVATNQDKDKGTQRCNLKGHPLHRRFKSCKVKSSNLGAGKCLSSKISVNYICTCANLVRFGVRSNEGLAWCLSILATSPIHALIFCIRVFSLPLPQMAWLGIFPKLLCLNGESNSCQFSCTSFEGP